MNTVKNFTTFHLQLNYCNILNDLSNKVCAGNKTEVLNLNVLNMITGIIESKTLIKHISCKCKCKFNGRNCNSNQWWNSDKCCCECKKRHVCEKDYIWNPTTCNYENGKYLANIMDDSAIMCDYINEKKNKKKTHTQHFYILLTFLLITIALLIAVSICYYLMKYRAKQNHSLLFNFTNKKLKEIIYQN